MTIARLESLCAWVGFAVLALGWWASGSSAFRARPVPGDLLSPIIAVELMPVPTDPADLQKELGKILGALDSPRRAEMARITGRDNYFVIAYIALFVLLGLLLWREGWRVPAVLVALLGLGGGIFDLMENGAILTALAGHAVTPRPWAVWKWGLLFAAVGLLSFAYLRPVPPAVRRSIGRLAAVLSILSAIIGLGGIAFRVDPLIESGAQLLTTSLLVGWIYFATHAWLANGFLAALDRVGDHRWLRWLTNWPSDEADVPVDRDRKH